MKSNDKRATAELLAALVEVAIAHGRRHYSETGEPLATTPAVFDGVQRKCNGKPPLRKLLRKLPVTKPVTKPLTGTPTT